MQFPLEAILDATGWKRSTWNAYWSKGMLAPFVEQVGRDKFKVVARKATDEWAVARAMTQVAPARELGASCASPLARALLKKARDNIVLALELYNRPSLENRLDAFCMLFCTAWEQLLKAEIIETSSEEAIYRPSKPGRRRESISLDEAVEQLFDSKNPVAQNIRRIAELRHGATHLLMPELQGILSRVFQAGVLNFAKRFRHTAAQSPFASGAHGLLSLVGEGGDTDVVSLRKLYGDCAGEEIQNLFDELSKQVAETKNPEFAISVEYRLVLTKKTTEGDISLSASNDGTIDAVVVEKPVPTEKTHPLQLKDLIGQVSQKAGEILSSYDLQAMLYKEKWKNGENAFHHHQRKPGIHWYSPVAAEELANKIKGDATYLTRARESYAASLKKSKKKPAQERPATTS